MNGITSWLNDPRKAFQLVAMAKQATAFVVSIMLVKAGWSTDLVGTYEEWFFLGAILTFAIVVGLLQAYLAIYNTLDDHAKSKLAFNVYLCLMATLILASTVLWIGGNDLIFVLLGIEILEHLALVLLFFVLHLSGTLAIYMLLLKAHSARTLVLFAGGYFVGLIVAICIGLQGTNQLLHTIQALIGFAILEHIYLIRLLLRDHLLRLDLVISSQLLRRALPLCGYSFLGAIGLLFDGWLVNRHFADSAVFAVFRYGARELPGSLALAGAFSAAMIPLVVDDFDQGLQRIHDGAKRLLHTFLPLSILLVCFSSELYQVFYSSDYLLSADIFAVYLLLMISRWMFGHSIMIAQGEEQMLVVFSLVEVAVNIILSVCWIQTHGLLGVAAATVIAFSLEKALIAIYLYKKYHVSPSRYLPTRIWFIYCVVLVAVFLTRYNVSVP